MTGIKFLAAACITAISATANAEVILLECRGLDNGTFMSSVRREVRYVFSIDTSANTLRETSWDKVGKESTSPPESITVTVDQVYYDYETKVGEKGKLRSYLYINRNTGGFQKSVFISTSDGKCERVKRAI